MANRYDLNIAGYALTVQSERSPEHMQRLGAMVNDRVREIQKAGSTTNYLHVILLASITMADELLELKERLDGQKDRSEAAEKSLLAALEQALEP